MTRGHPPPPPVRGDRAGDPSLDRSDVLASPQASRRRAPWGARVLPGDGDRPRRLEFAAVESSTTVEKSSVIQVLVGDPRAKRRGPIMNRAWAECLYQAKIFHCEGVVIKQDLKGSKNSAVVAKKKLCSGLFHSGFCTFGSISDLVRSHRSPALSVLVGEADFVIQAHRAGSPAISAEFY